jgi:hypothetical protein
MYVGWIMPGLAASLSFVLFAGIDEDCHAPTAGTVSPQVWKVDQAVAFRTKGLAVDADGAPDSYLVDGKGLSDTCDGVVALVDGKRVTKKSDPNHWYEICQKAWAEAVASGDFSRVAIFGFLTDKQHRPLIQSAGDPLPGNAYITTTSLTVPGTPDGVQRHWVDATKIPYIVLPSSFLNLYHVHPSDLAVVYRPKTKAFAFGIFADGGDLGEASVKLHRDLGNEPVTQKNGVARANRGIEDLIVTLVFPGNKVAGSVDAGAWNTAIEEEGKNALEKWGGMTRLQTCGK